MYSMCPFYSTVELSHCCSVLSFWMKINGDALPRMTMTITRVLHPPLEGDNVLTSLYCSVRPGEGIQCTWERAANNIQRLSWQTAISKRLRVSSPFLLQWTWFQLHERAADLPLSWGNYWVVSVASEALLLLGFVQWGAAMQIEMGSIELTQDIIAWQSVVAFL